MTLRLHVGPVTLVAGADFILPPGAARHAQVRRVQPGDTLLLFDGGGSDWPAEVLAVGRSSVQVRVGAALAVDRELPLAVTLAIGMPANERMDTLVEKATELGVACIQPLLCERSVLRLAGERAERKQAHWQGVAESACEQCGRALVPQVAPVLALASWLAALDSDAATKAARTTRLLLSPTADAPPLHRALSATAAESGHRLLALSGPEGGLAPAEVEAAYRAGFSPVGLGPRVLRADTAPLALLAWLGLRG